MLNIEIVFILKATVRTKHTHKSQHCVMLQEETCVKIGVSVCVCQTTLQTTIDLFVFDLVPSLPLRQPSHTHTYMRKFHCLNVSKCYRNSNVHTLPPQQAACKCSAESNLQGEDNLEREVNYGASCHVTFYTFILKGSLLSYFYSNFLKIEPTQI